MMKRLFVAIAAVILAAGVAAAQDYNAAVEVFNNAAVALNDGNKTEALSLFKQALPLFEACGEEGAEMVAKCKEQIPAVTLSIAKELINNKDFDKALETIKEAEAVAKEYGNEEIANDAVALIPETLNRKGAALLQAKDFATAAAVYEELTALQPENGQALLRLGQSLMNSGEADKAVEALKSAAANGQEATANKLIGTIFLKKGQSMITELKTLKDAKAKTAKAAEAAEAIKTSLEYVQNPAAYKLLASALTTSGKTGEAINAYKKYVEVAPNAADVPDYLFTIAATAQKSGDKATAIEYYNKLVSNAKYGEQAKAQLAALKK